MKEHPIIFNTENVKAILDGRKTMTRRVIRNKNGICPQCWGTAIPHNVGVSIFEDIETGQSLPYLKPVFCEHNDTTAGRIFCPYGQVGDRLWVRESFRYIQGGGEVHDFGVWYKADGEYKWWRDNEGLMNYPINEKNRPSIFMPRWASRIERIIALLRVECLRDITEADARAEGDYTVDEFVKLFLRINHLPEDANPWNWVIGW